MQARQERSLEVVVDSEAASDAKSLAPEHPMEVFLSASSPKDRFIEKNNQNRHVELPQSIINVRGPLRQPSSPRAVPERTPSLEYNTCIDDDELLMLVDAGCDVTGGDDYDIVLGGSESVVKAAPPAARELRQTDVSFPAKDTPTPATNGEKRSVVVVKHQFDYEEDEDDFLSYAADKAMLQALLDEEAEVLDGTNTEAGRGREGDVTSGAASFFVPRKRTRGETDLDPQSKTTGAPYVKLSAAGKGAALDFHFVENLKSDAAGGIFVPGQKTPPPAKGAASSSSPPRREEEKLLSPLIDDAEDLFRSDYDSDDDAQGADVDGLKGRRKSGSSVAPRLLSTDTLRVDEGHEGARPPAQGATMVPIPSIDRLDDVCFDREEREELEERERRAARDATAYLPPQRLVSRVPGKLCMSVTSCRSGERVFLKMDEPQTTEGQGRKGLSPQTPFFGGGRQLLSRPISELIQAVEDDRFRRIQRESAILAQAQELDRRREAQEREALELAGGVFVFADDSPSDSQVLAMLEEGHPYLGAAGPSRSMAGGASSASSSSSASAAGSGSWHRGQATACSSSSTTIPVPSVSAMGEVDDGGRKKRHRPHHQQRGEGLDSSSPSSSSSSAAGGSLWTDKYSPRSIAGLISDEKTNRELLLWLKAWEPICFRDKARAAAALRPPFPNPNTTNSSSNQSRISFLDATNGGGGNGFQAGAGVGGGASHGNAAAAASSSGPLTSRLPDPCIVLVSGPPGLGKTTLAHVAARHLGYQPVEVNASDDRTASTLMDRIYDAIEMTAVLGNGRPNCLILDEIDGATGGNETSGAINALVKFVRQQQKLAAAAAAKGGRAAQTDKQSNSKGPKTRDDEHNYGDEDDDDDTGGGRSRGRRAAESGSDEEGEEGGESGDLIRGGGSKKGTKSKGGRGGSFDSTSAHGDQGHTNHHHEGDRMVIVKKGQGGGRGKASQILRRPIICICNDLYAPALRPLRDVALVLQMRLPSRDRVVQRLRNIAAREGVAASEQALGLLADMTGRDLRSCLNSLQILARRRAAGATLDLGSNVNLAQKLPPITVKDVVALNVAVKDSSTSAFSIWSMLLSGGAAANVTTPRVPSTPFPSSNSAASPLRSEINSSSSSSRDRPGAGLSLSRSVVDLLCRKLNDFGDNQLALAGVFDNLPTLRFLDVNLQKTCQVADWLSRADFFAQGTARSLDFAIESRYVPACLSYVRLRVGESEKLGRNALRWPRSGGAVSRRLQAVRQLLRSWRSGSLTPAAAADGVGGWRMKPACVEAHSSDRLLRDLVPALSFLLSLSSVRPLAPHMLSASEQGTIAKLVGIMTQYGIAYCMQTPVPQGLPPLNPADLDITWGSDDRSASSNVLQGILGVAHANFGKPPLPGQRAAGYSHPSFFDVSRLVPLEPPIDTVHVYGGVAGRAISSALAAAAAASRNKNGRASNGSRMSWDWDSSGMAAAAPGPRFGGAAPAAEASWNPLTAVVSGGGPMAFGHRGGAAPSSEFRTGRAVVVLEAVRQMLMCAASIEVINHEEAQRLLTKAASEEAAAQRQQQRQRQQDDPGQGPNPRTVAPFALFGAAKPCPAPQGNGTASVAETDPVPMDLDSAARPGAEGAEVAVEVATEVAVDRREAVAGGSSRFCNVEEKLINEPSKKDDAGSSSSSSALLASSPPPPSSGAVPAENDGRDPKTAAAAMTSIEAPPPLQPAAKKTVAKAKGTWLDGFRVKAQAARKGVSAPAAPAALTSPAAEGSSSATSTGAPSDRAGPVTNVAPPVPPETPRRHRVLYKYNEGYTNAVKRPMLMRELL